MNNIYGDHKDSLRLLVFRVNIRCTNRSATLGPLEALVWPSLCPIPTRQRARCVHIDRLASLWQMFRLNVMRSRVFFPTMSTRPSQTFTRRSSGTGSTIQRAVPISALSMHLLCKPVRIEWIGQRSFYFDKETYLDSIWLGDTHKLVRLSCWDIFCVLRGLRQSKHRLCSRSLPLFRRLPIAFSHYGSSFEVSTALYLNFVAISLHVWEMLELR